MLSVVCGIAVLYIVYKRYIIGSRYDKDAADFYRRNGMLSQDDFLMIINTFTGAFDLISSLFASSIFNKICDSISGCLFLAAAGIIYLVKRQN